MLDPSATLPEFIDLAIIGAGPHALPNLPDWVGQIPTSYPQDRLLHSHQVDLTGLQLQGDLPQATLRERILIVGGGLTSGHLALGAVQSWQGCELFIMGGLAAL